MLGTSQFSIVIDWFFSLDRVSCFDAFLVGTFSASSAKFFSVSRKRPSDVPIGTVKYRNICCSSVPLLQILAVGPTTEGELKKHNVPVYATLRRPDPQSLIDCLQK